MATSINHLKGKSRFVEWGFSFLLYIYTAHIPAHIKSENSYFSYIYIQRISQRTSKKHVFLIHRAYGGAVCALKCSRRAPKRGPKPVNLLQNFLIYCHRVHFGTHFGHFWSAGRPKSRRPSLVSPSAYPAHIQTGHHGHFYALCLGVPIKSIDVLLNASISY